MKKADMCGGVTRRIDSKAPKQIKSTDMVLFSADSALQPSVGESLDDCANGRIDYISGYAAKLEGGCFLILDARNRFGREEFAKAFVTADIFPSLVKMTDEAQLAAHNGIHSFTHGLPMNFGGSVRIDYADGEQIAYSANQSPVFGVRFGIGLYELFSDYMGKERVKLPDVRQITAVSLYSESSFDTVSLDLIPDTDGGYVINKRYKFEEPKVFRYSDKVPDTVIESVRSKVAESYMLIWDRFPKDGLQPIKKTLTLVFADGSRFCVENDRALPLLFSSAFQELESILTAKY